MRELTEAENEGAAEEFYATPQPQAYGKDCPVGMVQIEFVGCPPEMMHGRYGWKPVPSAFLEIYVDGKRYRIDVGTFHDGVAERRGLHIVGPGGMCAELTAWNAASVYIPSENSRALEGSDA